MTDKPLVTLIDNMGTDLTVVNAARVSFDKESKLDSTGWDWQSEDGETVVKPIYNLKESDKKLIKYLAKHNHFTPFSQPQISFRIRMPIFVARQWFKHQVGFTRNEVSRRYVDSDPEFWVPRTIRKTVKDKKQGSSKDTLDYDALASDWEYYCNLSKNFYKAILDMGGCAEQARAILPQAMYTEFIETGSLAAYARLVKLRISEDAQLEIQEYAKELDKIIEPMYPVSWAALVGG